MTVIKLRHAPGVISLVVGFDVALLLVQMVILTSLSKRTMLFVSKDTASWLVMSITSWTFGFLVPVFLVALVELRMSPSMLSLIVGLDVALLLMKVVILALLGE